MRNQTSERKKQLLRGIGHRERERVNTEWLLYQQSPKEKMDASMASIVIYRQALL